MQRIADAMIELANRMEAAEARIERERAEARMWEAEARLEESTARITAMELESQTLREQERTLVCGSVRMDAQKVTVGVCAGHGRQCSAQGVQAHWHVS